MPLPIHPPAQYADYSLLRHALTPPLGARTARQGTLAAGPVTVSMNALGYAEGQVDYYVDGLVAARRTFNIGSSSVLGRAGGPTFFEGIANAFDVFPAFRGQGIARLLHGHLTQTLRRGGVDRILVKADRDGSAVWQRYYDWDFEESEMSAACLRGALFDTHVKEPLTKAQQAAWRSLGVRAGRYRIRGIPLRLRFAPERHWLNDYDGQMRISRHLIARHTIPDFARLEPGDAPVSVLLASINWHGVVCLTDRAAAHNMTLKRRVVAGLKSSTTRV